MSGCGDTVAAKFKQLVHMRLIAFVSRTVEAEGIHRLRQAVSRQRWL
ncbi:MAG: hypothetical protein AAF654_09015 [Myxococcota bacterium]